MARKKLIYQLPPKIRQELDRRIIQNGFSGYDALVAWLGELGYRISRSPIHQHGQRMKRDFEQTLHRLRMAEYMMSQMPDDAENALDKVNAVALRDRVFELIGEFEELGGESGDLSGQVKLVSALSLTQARLSRAGVYRQKWVEELRAKAHAAAEAVDKIAQKSGLSAETADAIRREILGIAG